MKDFPRKRHAKSGLMIQIALITVILNTPLRARAKKRISGAISPMFSTWFFSPIQSSCW